MTTKKIVIIEDDPAINHGIELTLGKEQYDFCCCYNLREAKDIHNADLVILDLNLPARLTPNYKVLQDAVRCYLVMLYCSDCNGYKVLVTSCNTE